MIKTSRVMAEQPVEPTKYRKGKRGVTKEGDAENRKTKTPGVQQKR